MSVPELSLTEQRVVLLLAAGHSKQEIAASVGLDLRTVEWHLVRAAQKLEVASALRQRVLRVISPGQSGGDGWPRWANETERESE